MSGRYASRSPNRLTVLSADGIVVEGQLTQVRLFDRTSDRQVLISIAVSLSTYQGIEDAAVFGVALENIARDEGAAVLTDNAPVTLELELLNPPADTDLEAVADQLATNIGVTEELSSAARFRWWRTLQAQPSTGASTVMLGFRSRFAAAQG